MQFGTYSTFAVYYSEIEENAMIALLSEEGEDTTTQIGVSKVEEAEIIGLKTNEVEEQETVEQDNPTQEQGTSQEQTPSQNSNEQVTTNESEEPKQENLTPFTNNDIDVKIEMSTSGEELKNGESVKEGQYVDYKVTMTNKSNSKELVFDLEVSKENGTFYGLNVVDYSLIENEPLNYYEELEDEILKKRITIKPGDTEEFKYTIVANKETEGKKLISEVAFKQNGNDVIDNIKTENSITRGLIKLNTTLNHPEEATTYSMNIMQLVITVTNLTDRDLSNVVVTMELPKLLSYKYNEFYEKESRYDSLKQEDNNTLKMTINTLKAGEEAPIYLLIDVGSFGVSEEKTKVSIMSNATVNGENYSSNIYEREIVQGQIFVTSTMSGSILDEYVKHGDELTYIIEVETLGVLEEEDLNISDSLPKGVNIQDYTIIDADGNEKTYKAEGNYINISGIKIEANKKVTVKIRTIIDENQVEGTILKNRAELVGIKIKETRTNTVTYKLQRTQKEDPIVPSNPNDPNNPSNPDSPSNPNNPEDPTNPETPTDETFEITGTVWEDVNSDGKRDASESGIEGITVKLMNNKKSEFVKNSEGKEIESKTAIDGTYRFEDLKSGEYVVVFMYDTKLYETTTYQKSGVNSMVNSDAIDGELTIDSVKTKVALTDLIDIGQASKNNIDLGLISKNKFDLKIEKIVNTVIVQNKQGTNTYTFKNNKTAKIEIPAKQMVGSNITIEYKINVINEGDVAGTASKIIDYLPNDLEFSSEINNEWYRGVDGNIYTEELANTIINPGETKTVTLVLTKVMKEAAAENTINTAEIAEHYNTLGLDDTDSTPGNKAQKEDDLSTAELIITIKTGVLTYTLIILGVAILIALLGAGVYLIKKKVMVIEE